MLRNYKYYTLIIQQWKHELQQREFQLKVFFILLFFYFYSKITQELGIFIESKKGIHLHDTILQYIPQADYSVPIFILLYSSLLLLLTMHLHQPKFILKLIEFHIVIALIRQFCILLIALEPPHGIIVLKDIFLENTFYPHQMTMTKDLFFSGHIASMWLYFLMSKHTLLKKYLLSATIVMSYMILSMRIHYSYDVYAAIIITTLAYKIPTWVHQFAVKKTLVSESRK